MVHLYGSCLCLTVLLLGRYQDTGEPQPSVLYNANLLSVHMDFLSFHPLSLLSPKHTHDPGPESLRGNNSVRFRSESRDRRQFQGSSGSGWGDCTLNEMVMSRQEPMAWLEWGPGGLLAQLLNLVDRKSLTKFRIFHKDPWIRGWQIFPVKGQTVGSFYICGAHDSCPSYSVLLVSADQHVIRDINSKTSVLRNHHLQTQLQVCGPLIWMSNLESWVSGSLTAWSSSRTGSGKNRKKEGKLQPQLGYVDRKSGDQGIILDCVL